MIELLLFGGLFWAISSAVYVVFITREDPEGVDTPWWGWILLVPAILYLVLETFCYCFFNTDYPPEWRVALE